MKRIAVCCPASRPHPRMMYDISQLMAYSTKELVGKNIADLGLLVGEQTYIDRAREDLTLSALYGGDTGSEWLGVTHMLWIDDDMRFPKDALVRLLNHRKDFVAANYPKRGMPCTPNAFKTLGLEAGTGKTFCYTRKESTGLEEVEGVGFGLALIRTEAFREIDRPWFSTHYDKRQGWLVGEDIDFCRKFRKTGRMIYVDHDLSKQVYHMGWYEYGYEAALAAEEIAGVKDAHATLKLHRA